MIQQLLEHVLARLLQLLYHRMVILLSEITVLIVVMCAQHPQRVLRVLPQHTLETYVKIVL